ncbi:unnamed protein product [Moneuplotes crassus]|uniref:Uncharacterized protein n=1 Tax=Euplotes crassus TaxID=5936 RepID=A0AAD1X923_EUPCR|nr:unnamed protein product [Moneuplotes crassus]
MERRGYDEYYYGSRYYAGSKYRHTDHRYAPKVVRSSIKYDYEGPIRQINLDNEELKKILSIREDEVRILQSEIQTFKSNETNKEKEKESRALQLSQTEKRIVSLTQKIADSKTKLQNLQGGDRKADLQRLLEIMSTKQNEEDEMQARFDKLKKELALLKEDGRKLQASANEKETEIEEFEDEQQAKQISEKQEIESLELILSTSKKDAEQLDTKIGEEDLRIRDIDVLNKEIEIINEEIKVRKEDFDELKDDLHVLKEEVKDLRGKALKIRIEKAQNEKQVSQYKNDIMVFKKNIEELTDAINKLCEAKDKSNAAPGVNGNRSRYYGNSLRGLYDIRTSPYAYQERPTYSRSSSLGRKTISHPEEYTSCSRYSSFERTVHKDPEVIELCNKKKFELKHSRVFNLYNSRNDTCERLDRNSLDHSQARHHNTIEYDRPYGERHSRRLKQRLLSSKNHTSILNRLLEYPKASAALDRMQDFDIFELADQQTDNRISSVESIFDEYSQQNQNKPQKRSRIKKVFNAAMNMMRKRENAPLKKVDSIQAIQCGKRCTSTKTKADAKTICTVSKW